MREITGGIKLEEGPILVTGAAGFVGSHIMKELSMGYGDIAADLTDDYPVPEGVKKIHWKLPSSAPEELGAVRYIVHLAAISSVSKSLQDVHHAYEVNLMGTISVLEYMVSKCRNARMLLASSSEVYESTDDLITEKSKIGPCNPYGTTKAAAEIASAQFARTYDIDVVVSRAFPHFGSGQSSTFAIPSFCRRVIAAERSGEEAITAGNLSPVRDYLYINDVIRAYTLILAKGLSGSIYNVCSGHGVTIEDIVEKIIDLSGKQLNIILDDKLFRPADIKFQVGSPARIQALLGWEKRYSLEDGLKNVLQWWRERT